jgi:hypothetical protein
MVLLNFRDTLIYFVILRRTFVASEQFFILCAFRLIYVSHYQKKLLESFRPTEHPQLLKIILFLTLKKYRSA